MSAFIVNRAFLNPKFEGYKLSLISQEDVVACYPLQYHPSQATESGRTRTPLSVEEVRSRIGHNYLSIGHDGDAVYIDGDLRVIRVTLNETGEPSCHCVFEIPVPVVTQEEAAILHKDNPSVISLSKDLWLVTDGQTLAYIIRMSDNTSQQCAVFELPRSQTVNQSVPFKIHTARLLSDTNALAILSCRSVEQPDMGASSKTTSVPQFDVFLVSLSFPEVTQELQQMKVLWHSRGVDIPVFCGFSVSRNAFYLLGGSNYTRVDAPQVAQYDPSPDEIAPIPRAGENMDDAPAAAQKVTKPPPYSWTQTGDSVTIAFPLPASVNKTAISVHLTTQTLSLTIKAPEPPGITFPKFSLKKFWDNTDSSASFWTWDREADRNFGLLTLHLEKQHEGTRWAHVFASVGTESGVNDMDPTDVEVPETLDPSELWHIRDALEKYTSALKSGEDASGLGLGKGVPSLAENEMDMDVDEGIGRRVAITWVGIDGQKPACFGPKDLDASVESVELLSLPLPMNGPASESTLVTKAHIDGNYYALPTEWGESPVHWTHAFTYPVLGFVLASKRDTKFTYHVSTKACLAFESGSTPGGGNVYIYWGGQAKEPHAKQSVLKIAGGTAGALLGAGRIIKEGSSTGTLLCLCENELVVVKNVI